MATIIGIAGSLRAGSLNAKLLRAAVELAPPSLKVEIETIRDIPLYDGDVEAQGIPPAVARLKDRVATADGLLLVSPEYNNSIPGVFKNAIDWMSRPPADAARVFRGRRVAVIGATPGRGSTSLGQAAWLPVLRTLGTQPWFGGRLGVAQADKAFDEAGRLVDDRIRDELKKFMHGFAAFVSER